jgi:hypothetical protein
MQTIRKYAFSDLGLTNRQDFTMPAGSQVVHVGWQERVPTMWFLVDRGVRWEEQRSFVVVGTGREVPTYPGKLTQYVGTCQDAHNLMVLHIFEIVALCPV